MLFYLQTIDAPEDRRLFERLYERYGRLMFSAALRIVKSNADAEDAVHQAFVYIAGNMNKLRKIEEGKRKALLLLITEHKAVDILRKNSGAIPMEDPDSLPGLSLNPPSDSPLAAALAGLNARYREAIILRYAYGYSTREIAIMYRTTQENIQRLLHRAKTALAKKLAEMERE